MSLFKKRDKTDGVVFSDRQIKQALLMGHIGCPTTKDCCECPLDPDRNCIPQILASIIKTADSGKEF